jgi:hypothetical protein
VVVDGALLNTDKDHDERRIRTLHRQELQYRRHSGAYSPTGLTEANNNTESITVKPGSGNTRNAEIRYKICVSVVSQGVDAFRCSDTHPKAAVNESGLDQESENLFDFHGDAAFTHILLYGDAMFPADLSENESPFMLGEHTKPSRLSTRWKEGWFPMSDQPR